MFKEGLLRRLIPLPKDKQSNSLSIDWERDGWSDRYLNDENINKWQMRAQAIFTLLSKERTRKEFINETDPKTQYALLELAALFTQTELKDIKKSPPIFNSETIPIVGELFGEILVHNVSNININERKTSFLKNRWRLNIGTKSKIIALELLFREMNNLQQLDQKTIDYIISLISDLDFKDSLKLKEKFPIQIMNAWEQYVQELSSRSSANFDPKRWYMQQGLHRNE